MSLYTSKQQCVLLVPVVHEELGTAEVVKLDVHAVSRYSEVLALIHTCMLAVHVHVTRYAVTTGPSRQCMEIYSSDANAAA